MVRMAIGIYIQGTELRAVREIRSVIVRIFMTSNTLIFTTASQMGESCPQRDYIKVVEASRQSELSFDVTIPNSMQGHDLSHGDGTDDHAAAATPVSVFISMVRQPRL